MNMAGFAKLSTIFRSLSLSSNYNRSLIHTTACVNRPNVRLILQGIDPEKYTVKPLSYPKLGGRGPNGRVENRRVGGGFKHKYRMIDYKRLQPERADDVVYEKVLQVRYDPLRTADLALVATGNIKRYIIASEKMKVGDILQTSREIPAIPVKAVENYSYPVGALPAGTLVHNIERLPDEGGKVARAAGVSGVIMKKIEKTVIIKMPSGREMSVDRRCMGTVGRVSNVEHINEHIGSAARSRWMGIRPKSGLFKKKTGYNGRKIKKKKPLVVYEKKSDVEEELLKFQSR